MKNIGVSVATGCNANGATHCALNVPKRTFVRTAANGGIEPNLPGAATRTNGSFGERSLDLELHSGWVWPCTLEERHRSNLRSIKGMVKIGPVMVTADDTGGKSEPAEGLEL